MCPLFSHIISEYSNVSMMKCAILKTTRLQNVRMNELLCLFTVCALFFFTDPNRGWKKICVESMNRRLFQWTRFLQCAWLCRLSLVSLRGMRWRAFNISLFENSKFSNTPRIVSFKGHMMKFHQSLYVRVCACVYVCVYMYLWAFLHVQRTVRMFVCVYVCLLLSMIFIEFVRFAYIWISR